MQCAPRAGQFYAAVLTVCRASEFDTVIAAQAREPNSGLIVMPDTFTIAHRVEITSLAARYRLAAIIPRAENYRSSQRRRTAGRRLQRRDREAHSASLPWGCDRHRPVETPAKFELVINLKTAKALGLDVPLFLQQRADAVIE
jgi:putative ABC transport system substrate-binding protein